MKKEKLILQFPKFQFQFFFILLIIIGLVYFYQILLGAEVYSKSGYNDASDFHLIKVQNLGGLYFILLLISSFFPIIGIFLKKYKIIWINLLFSYLYIFILFTAQQFNQFYNCMDFCGFITIFIMPEVVFILAIISSIILFFINRKVVKS